MPPHTLLESLGEQDARDDAGQAESRPEETQALVPQYPLAPLSRQVLRGEASAEGRGRWFVNERRGRWFVKI